MRLRHVASVMIGVALGCFGGSATPISACGYHGTLGSGFSALHPASLDVAIATREAIDRGALKALKPLPSLVALAHAGRRLDHVRRSLLATLDADRPPTPIALLLVEPGLWTRYHADAGQLSVDVHAAGPRLGDEIIVMSEAALQALIDQDVSVDRAISDGLVALAGRSDAEAMGREALRHIATRRPGP